eukprot:gnl/Spiro4/9066_TR4782_c0_g1_i1.p1 gnl/Spiro4/9066_TR4782_c0_g1~~gnl/Spiro4/9066_TR4782_c0_g1_i1.p1  ORF type:complete len:428 (-),score=101.41 gnl/Spiro4/9066_TR4782_c0_g1_i1:67-1320(-)
MAWSRSLARLCAVLAVCFLLHAQADTALRHRRHRHHRSSSLMSLLLGKDAYTLEEGAKCKAKVVGSYCVEPYQCCSVSTGHALWGGSFEEGECHLPPGAECTMDFLADSCSAGHYCVRPHHEEEEEDDTISTESLGSLDDEWSEDEELSKKKKLQKKKQEELQKKKEEEMQKKKKDDELLSVSERWLRDTATPKAKLTNSPRCTSFPRHFTDYYSDTTLDGSIPHLYYCCRVRPALVDKDKDKVASDEFVPQWLDANVAFIKKIVEPSAAIVERRREEIIVHYQLRERELLEEDESLNDKSKLTTSTKQQKKLAAVGTTLHDAKTQCDLALSLEFDKRSDSALYFEDSFVLALADDPDKTAATPLIGLCRDLGIEQDPENTRQVEKLARRWPQGVPSLYRWRDYLDTFITFRKGEFR